MTDLTTLADRIEAGTVEMQEEILRSVRDAVLRDDFSRQQFNRKLDAGAYVDAAMMLVPEGLHFEVTTTGFKPGATVCGNVLTGPHEGAYAATPALALAAACLRAHSAEATNV